MVAKLSGIRFDQVYGDNSGGDEFDTDGDGSTTQEDEFVSFTNTTGSTVDVSGWQIWSDMTGVGAPDSPQDGLYHTFAPGTTIAPNQTLYIINEISGTEPGWADEASEGGVESGAGGENTNFLTEGGTDTNSEAVFLVNPDTGDYIVFNMSSSPPNPGAMSGFPGTTNIGTVEAASIHEDQNAGSSYQFDSATGQYKYGSVFVPCFTPGVLISTPNGDRPVEQLCVGDMVLTVDNGPRPICHILKRHIDLTNAANQKSRPIRVSAGAFGPDCPSADLVVSPQHRIFVTTPDDKQVLVPAKGLLNRDGVTVVTDWSCVTYIHIAFDHHEVVTSNGLRTESFFPGPYFGQTGHPRLVAAMNHYGAPARPFLTVSQTRRFATDLFSTPSTGRCPAPCTF